eukprot:CAMPEP_0194132022 /NCGR_PEP_ID=MMETSP0152-20130528/2597_1 /TAXON_ID=1049557 /ORGANISM="Thalassiothrix antarctica, Strain L6-D1" /LENGTH=585 /DNA_ID=CAMNT_0038826933 /DNA_START=197 /DNA_END=1954 /DNA_ORIENTATION=+
MQVATGFTGIPRASQFVRLSALSYSTSTSLALSKKDAAFPTWSFEKHCDRMEWNELHPFKLTATNNLAYEDSDLVILGIYGPPKNSKENDEEDKDDDEEELEVTLTGITKEIDDGLGGILTEVIDDNAKNFKAGSKKGIMTPTVRVPTKDGKSKRYVVIGLGDAPDKEEKKSPLGRILGKAIAQKIHDEAKVQSCSVVLPNLLEDATSLTDFSSSLYSTLYSDDRYRTGQNLKPLAKDLTSVILVSPSSIAESANTDLENGKRIAQGIFLAKDIVNSPHNILNSESLADTAKRIASESGGHITCNILDRKDCEERGMGSYLGVARGSETEPQFIHLVYSPKNKNNLKRVGIVGKGLLFDTGGYNIKTAMMELMKSDCGGAAAVLGAARAVGALAPDGVEAHFIVAACENMINERAMVPSDILTASNGKTIEIINTDAEGRLTLADALVFADKEVNCESIIELSTLTGACMVSLGQEVCGVWTSNDDLANELKDISDVTGEKSWRMPLEEAYNEQLKSKIADITNCGTRYGGAITAALFLENFVSKKKPFAHIDIAGPAWDDKAGATGFGARLIIEWIHRNAMKGN